MTECCEPEPELQSLGLRGGQQTATTTGCEGGEEITTTECPHAGTEIEGTYVGYNCIAYTSLSSSGRGAIEDAIQRIADYEEGACRDLKIAMEYLFFSGRFYEFYEEPNPGTGFSDTTQTKPYSGVYDPATGHAGINLAWVNGYLPSGRTPYQEYMLIVAHEAAHSIGIGLVNDADAEDLAKQCLSLI
jgi:hypothetical protein